MHILPETNAINIIAKEGKKSHFLIIKNNVQKTTEKKRTDEKKKTLENMWLFMRGMNTARLPLQPLSRTAVTARANKDDGKGGKKDKSEEHGD